ncbi:MAG: TauD/TfdA family dioxygenase [Chlamydiales bacterium]
MESWQTQFINQEKLPLVLKPKKPNITFDAFLNSIQENREFIENQLFKYGGLLFRGFPVKDAEKFHAVIEALNFGKPLNYIGGDSPRQKVSSKVYTSTDAPPNIKIPLHNEMSFVKNYPKHIYFYCDIPPASGGETIIADARDIYKSIDPAVKTRFINKNLKYISNFYKDNWLLDRINRYKPAHKTWMQVFETENKNEVEKSCVESKFGYKWNPNDWLQVIYEAPSSITHPKTHENIWFNQAHLYDYNPKLLGFWNWVGTKFVYFKPDTVMHAIYYGDGDKISRKDLYHVMDVLDRKTVKFPWEKGDVMVLDNILAMHGRAPFTGKRRILTMLTR